MKPRGKRRPATDWPKLDPHTFVEATTAAWDASHKATQGVIPIEIGRRRAVINNIEVRLTNNPLNVAMITLLRPYQDPKYAMAASMRFFALTAALEKLDGEFIRAKDHAVHSSIIAAAAITRLPRKSSAFDLGELKETARELARRSA